MQLQGLEAHVISQPAGAFVTWWLYVRPRKAKSCTETKSGIEKHIFLKIPPSAPSSFHNSPFFGNTSEYTKTNMRDPYVFFL
jgi:hypothetical protein